MGVVNRRWVRVESMGGCKEVYRFHHITYLVSALFFAASLLFVHF